MNRTITRSSSVLDPQDREAVLIILEQHYYDKTTALNYSNPFELLLATILSAQTTDKQVNKVTAELFGKYKTPQQFAALSAEQLAEEIKGLGLYRNKSKNIVACCQKLIDHFDSEVPQTREELMSLDGVGRKTANVVMAFAFDKPAFPVDTHVFRVTNRLGLVNSKNADDCERQLMQRVPEEKWSQAHHWLIWHGREICTARKPLCGKCMLSDYCRSYNIDQPDSNHQKTEHIE